MFEQNVGAQPNYVSWKNKLHGEAPNPNNLYFTKAWPGTYAWASGKFFEIKKSTVIDFKRTYTIPESDYANKDLSNATSGLNLYPETTGYVHEILLGFKSWEDDYIPNFVAQIEIPAGKYLAKLPQASMIPSTTDATLKYLNAKEPTDSPADNPTLKFWAIKDMPAIVVRLLTLSGVDFVKATMVFKIAIHKVEELKTPPSVFTSIPWHEELALMG